MTPRRAIALAATISITAALAGCAPGTPAPPQSGDGESVAPSATAAPAPVEWANPDAPEAFKFMAADLVTGETIDGTTLAGQDTILWFWASWCPVCAAETGVFLKAQPDFPEGTQFLGIAGLSDSEAAQGFVSEHGMDQFSHVYDEDGSIWRNFSVSSQPTMILIQSTGESQTYVGGYGYHDVVEKIAWLGEA